MINKIVDAKYSVQILTAFAGIMTTVFVLHLDQTIRVLPGILS